MLARERWLVKPGQRPNNGGAPVFLFLFLFSLPSQIPCTFIGLGQEKRLRKKKSLRVGTPMSGLLRPDHNKYLLFLFSFCMVRSLERESSIWLPTKELPSFSLELPQCVSHLGGNPKRKLKSSLISSYYFLFPGSENKFLCYFFLFMRSRIRRKEN